MQCTCTYYTMGERKMTVSNSERKIRAYAHGKIPAFLFLIVEETEQNRTKKFSILKTKSFKELIKICVRRQFSSNQAFSTLVCFVAIKADFLAKEQAALLSRTSNKTPSGNFSKQKSDFSKNKYLHRTRNWHSLKKKWTLKANKFERFKKNVAAAKILLKMPNFWIH